MCAWTHSYSYIYLLDTSVPLLSVGNRPIDQEEDEGREEEGGRKKGSCERGKRWKESTLLSFSRMKTDGRTDERTKFLYESREKTSLRSVLISHLDGNLKGDHK